MADSDEKRIKENIKNLESIIKEQDKGKDQEEWSKKLVDSLEQQIKNLKHELKSRKKG